MHQDFEPSPRKRRYTLSTDVVFHGRNILLGIAGFSFVLALPIGFLLYRIYLFLEFEKIIKNRKGMKIVPKILEKHKKEYKWWINHKYLAERNEILDIAFYSENEGKYFASILERLLTFYHSNRIAGKYTLIFAGLFTAAIVTIQFLNSFDSAKCNCLAPVLQITLSLLLIFGISLILLIPTWQNGILKKQIDELEANVLLLRKEKIIETIRQKIQYDT